MIRRKVLTIDGATDIAALLDQHRGPYPLGKTSNPVYLLLSEQPATAWQTHAWKHSDGVKVASIEAVLEGSRLAVDRGSRGSHAKHP